MLQKLFIQNYAIIRELEMDFKDGMTVITGETGAGKSILLGALSLILGKRADTQILFSREKKCIVEGSFKIKPYGLKPFFEENNLDFEDYARLRREINPDGKSRAFINDTPVNLNQLRELGEQLVDIHSQHETLLLKESGFHFHVLDEFAGVSNESGKHSALYHHWLSLKKQLGVLYEKEKLSKADKDYFQFQFNELEEAKLKAGEQQQMEQELETLTHAEEIKSKIASVVSAWKESDANLLQQVKESENAISAAAKYSSTLKDMAARIKSVYIEIKDIAEDLEHLENSVSFDPERIRVVQDRLNIIYQLQQKHRAATAEELIAVKNDFASRLSSIDSLDGEIKMMEKQIADERNDLLKLSKEISAKRKTAIPFLEKKVQKLLSETGMPDGILKVRQNILSDEDMNAGGLDDITMLFSANKGSAPAEVGSVASGGELSRLMLCIKSILADYSSLPVIIFDEIDSGISGDIASRVADVIQKMSAKRQVIIITHLPQMAGRGNHHFKIIKKTEKGIASTQVISLNEKERVNEIAEMISGKKLTETAVEHARELLER